MMENSVLNSKIDITTALGKSSGSLLLRHCKNVSATAVFIAKKILLGIDIEIIETIKYSGLFHDIAKISEKIQKFFNGKAKNTDSKYYHNEIGWAFLYKYSNLNDYVNNAIYWHHGITNEMNANYCDEILDSLSETDINSMKEIVKELAGDFILNDGTKSGLTKTPKFYTDNEEYNAKITIIRTCIVNADKIVSRLEEENPNIEINENNALLILDNLTNKIINKSTEYALNSNEYDQNLNIDRFNLQLEIANKCAQTTKINAPAGFGKTMVGTLNGLLNKRKILWICPRNIVAESAYETILKDMKMLGLELKVELYLTGEVQKRNHGDRGEFSSDIIVTNIDSFLMPTINDRFSSRLILLLYANVIFDEYHEICTCDAPMNACFINIMRVRHQFTDGKTLLLSATAIKVEYLWDTIGRKTLTLPDEKNHYPAIHNKKYLFHVFDGTPNHNLNECGSNAIIYNSIRQAQIQLNSIPNSMLFHSEFEENALKEKYEKLLNDFGNESIKTFGKYTVISTLIMQASLNLSFHSMSESIQSPETTTHRLGRCDRFGDYPGKSEFTIFKAKSSKNNLNHNRSEKAVIELFYEMDLMDKWFKEILPYNNKELTLDEYYKIYNAHVLKYSEERKKFFNKKYRNSLKLLTELYPVRFFEAKSKSKIVTADGNKLRAVGGEIFFIVHKYGNSNEYVGPFTATIYKSIDVDFNELGNIRGRLLGSMNTIMKNENNKFDYSGILDKKGTITLDEIRKQSRFSNTPYIRYDKVYHPEYGLIYANKLNEIV
jgi:CRISPR-associated endonuclease Cas3-HD